MSNQNRQPAGAPNGGQFAASARAESATELTVPNASVDADATGDVGAHIRTIAKDAGYHPTEGVLPAVLVAIHDRGEDDTSALLQLTAYDLEHLYDTHLGPALDDIQEEIRWLAEQRKTTRRK